MKTLFALVFKLSQSAEHNWQKIRGFDALKILSKVSIL